MQDALSGTSDTPKARINEQLKNSLTNTCYPNGWSLKANLEAIRAIGKQGNPFFLAYTKTEIKALIANKKQRKITLFEVLALHDLGYQ